MKRALVPSDLYRLAIPHDPRGAGDGRIFFVLDTPDEAADETSSSIHSVRDGRPPIAFTSGKKDRMRPAADGSRLAFVADRGDGKRVYVAPLDGGEAQAASDAYDAITALEWSPQSDVLAFVATAAHDAGSARIAHDEKSGARHITGLPFKSDDDGLLDGRRKHLFVLTLGDGGTEQITSGDFDVNAPAWSPDGMQLAFSAQIDAPEGAFFSDIYVVTRSDRTRVKLTHSRGPAGHPAFSHSGRTIAYIGHERGDDAGGRFNTELFVIPSEGGEPRSLSASVDRSVSNFVICDTRGVGGEQAPFWSADDAEVFVPLSNEGTCGIAAFRADGVGHRTVLEGERDIYAFSRSDDGAFAFVYATPTVPSEIASCDAAGNERRLTDANPWLAERAIRAPRRMRPSARDGTPLDLWVLEPDPSSDGDPPLVLQVHGGPHAAYGYAFMFEFQMLAGLGIGVAYGNPRGSQTYGHAYADAITGDWGGIDVADVLSLLDGALTKGRYDRSRIGIAGGLVRWLHDDVAARPQRSFRSRHFDARRQRSGQRSRRDRSRLVPRTRSRGAMGRRRGEAVRELADAQRPSHWRTTAGVTFRARLSLRDRSGRAAVHTLATVGAHADRIRALHGRRPQSLAHRQAAQPRAAAACYRALAHPPSAPRGYRADP